MDDHVDVSDKLIPSTFEEETNFLDSEAMLRLKLHYMTYYWQLRKEFLNYLEDFMTHDYLIGSTISTISKNNASYVSKISSPSILTENTEISKRSENSNAHNFYPKNFNYAFLPKLDFEGYRNDVKKRYEDDQNMLDVDEHQMPDHSRTFTKMIKLRGNEFSAANDERLQVLSPCIIWDGSIDRFEVLETMLKVIMEKLVKDTNLIQNFRLHT